MPAGMATRGERTTHSRPAPAADAPVRTLLTSLMWLEGAAEVAFDVYQIWDMPCPSVEAAPVLLP